MVFRGEQREDQSSPAEYKKGLQRDDWHRGIVGNLLLDIQPIRMHRL